MERPEERVGIPRTMALLPALGIAAIALGQCPSVRPRFSWASNDSAIVFTDQTGAFATERIWEFGDGNTASDPVVTHGYAFAGDDTVRLTLVVGGCTFSVGGRVVHPGVNDDCGSQLSSSFNTEQIGNNHIQFNDDSQGDGSFLFHLWTFGDDSISVNPSTPHFYIFPGDYDVSHSIGTVDSQFQTACVAGSARKVFVNGNTSTCDSSLFLGLTAYANGPYVTLNADAVLFNADLVITSWEWDYGDGTPVDQSVLPLAEHYYPYGGEVQICLQVWTTDTTDGDSCFARNCITVSMDQQIGMAEAHAEPTLIARPVPFQEELWLEGKAVRKGTPWRMLDATGRVATQGTFAQEGAARIDAGALPSGIYTVLIPVDGGFRSVRSLKQ